jgi:hypothetical protein
MGFVCFCFILACIYGGKKINWKVQIYQGFSGLVQEEKPFNYFLSKI